MDAVDPNKPLSFSSMNGTIDVTLPADFKANVKLRTDHGEIYSDFDFKLSGGAITQKNDSSDGKFKVTMDRTIYRHHQRRRHGSHLQDLQRHDLPPQEEVIHCETPGNRPACYGEVIPRRRSLASSRSDLYLPAVGSRVRTVPRSPEISILAGLRRGRRFRAVLRAQADQLART